MALTKPMDSSVDYLTCSMKPTEQAQGLFYAMAMAIRQNPDFNQSEAKPWFFRGYKGFQLLSGNSGHFAYGEHSHQGFLVQMSGEYSSKFWLTFVSVADNTSRIDLKTDCELYEPNQNWAQICYHNLLDASGQGGRSFTLLMGNRGRGQTLYVGSRKSDQFGRFYDKSAQMGETAGRVWRYEVEFKKKRAKAVADIFAKIGNEEDRDTLANRIAQEVYWWFDCRGVPPLFDWKGARASKIEVNYDGQIGKIDWIRKQVSPTVKRLIMAGRGEDVIDALGIRDYFSMPQRPGP